MTVITDIARAAAITSGSTQDVTTTALSGVTPSACIVWTTSAVTNGTDAAHAITQIGFFDGTRNQSVCQAGEDGQASSDSYRFPDSSNTIAFIEPAGTAASNGIATFSFISGGVRVSWSELPDEAFLMHFMIFAGDDLSVHAAYEDGITTSTVDITAPGFQPEIVFFASCVNGTDGSVGTGDSRISFGVSDGTTHSAFSRNFRDNEGTIRNLALVSTSKVIDELGDSAINDSLAAEAFDSSGFSLNPNTEWTGKNVIYLALTTGGVAPPKIQLYASPTVAEEDPVTGIGFEPEAVLMLCSKETSRDSVDFGIDSSSQAFGMFTANDEFCLNVINQDNPSVSNAISRSQASALHVRNNTASGDDQIAAFVSMDSDGFTLDHTTVMAAARMFTLIAFEGVAAAPAGGNPWYYYAQQKAA